MMIPEYSIWLFNAFVLVLLMIMVLTFTYFQASKGRSWQIQTRYYTFGVLSFILIGTLLAAYVVYLSIIWSVDYVHVPWLLPIRDDSYDLMNGFFTVLVGAAAGIFVSMFAYLKHREGLYHG